MFEQIPSFFNVGAWILAGIVLAGGAASQAAKAWHFFHKPAHEARSVAEEGDKSLQEQMDEIQAHLKKHDDYFASDHFDIKQIKKEIIGQGHTDALMVDGISLIMQHLITGNHTSEMKKWMRDYLAEKTESSLDEEGE